MSERIPEGISFIVNRAYEGLSPIHKCDEKIPMSSFRTTSIFHYTKDLMSLKMILEDGVIPNFCSEELAPDVTIGIPMVSFCDIPLGRTHEHVSRYGHFAIGLATEYGERNNINPVFYVNNEHFMNLILERDDKGNVDVSQFISSPVSGLYKKCYGEYDEKEISNYSENEWRYIVAQSDDLHWHKSKEEYVEWRKTGIGKNKPNPINNLVLYNKRLIFELSDINYLIVEKEKNVSELIDYIYRMRFIGGSAVQLSQKDKLYLISRIRSIESIRRDY